MSVHSTFLLPTPLQFVEHPLVKEKGLMLHIKRDDLTHPHIQGNKYRKLKYNLVDAVAQRHDQIMTFGGPMSNHIYATAAAGKLMGLKTIGIIRGYANLPLTPMLQFAKEQGMEFRFLSKSEYENRFDRVYLKGLKRELGDFYMIPDGGSNLLALKGVVEMMQEIAADYDVCCVAVGTGGTLAGCVIGSQDKEVIGFSSLKGEGTLKEEVKQLMNDYSIQEGIGTIDKEIIINTDYHFGGYGKMTEDLAQFIAAFYKEQNILLDPVYTSKMLFGIFDLVKKDFFKPGTRIVAIHTGGLQGWTSEAFRKYKP